MSQTTALRTFRSMNTRRIAQAAVAGQVVFTLGWLVAGAAEGHGYSVADHEISDLAALTAHAAPVLLVAQAVCGIATAMFGLVALPRLLHGTRGATLAGVLIAASALGAGNVSDALFRLDCRAADGCSQPESTASWHGQIHGAVGLLTILVLAVAPFVVARVLRRNAAWADLARPSLAFGVVLLLSLVVGVGLTDRPGAGLAQRMLALAAATWVALLGLRAARLAVASGRRAEPLQIQTDPPQT